MRRLILAAILAASPAFAGPVMIARNEAGDSVRLSHEPCKITEHPAFPKGVPSVFEKAIAEISKQVFEACWAVRVADMTVVVIYPDGDFAEIPLALFKPDGA